MYQPKQRIGQAAEKLTAAQENFKAQGFLGTPELKGTHTIIDGQRAVVVTLHEGWSGITGTWIFQFADYNKGRFEWPEHWDRVLFVEIVM